MLVSKSASAAVGSRTVNTKRHASTGPCVAAPPAGRQVKMVVVARMQSSGTTTLRRSGHFGARVAPSAPAKPTGSFRSSPRRSQAVRVEANLFTRLYRVVKSYVDNVVGSFEDPEKLLDKVVEEMTEDALRMRQATAQATASQRQMQARQKNMQEGADQWLRRAELAVSRGQDDLAREALARRKTLQTEADRMQKQLDAQTKAVDQLSGSVRMLENKIAEAKGKKETLKARAASAKTSIAIQEMIGGLRTTGASSFAAFDKMEEKVMALEAEAEATAALSTPDGLEARFSQLEVGNVEDELQALKSDMRKQQQQALPPYPRIEDVFQPNARQAEPQGVSRGNALDQELEELRRRARTRQ